MSEEMKKNIINEDLDCEQLDAVSGGRTPSYGPTPTTPPTGASLLGGRTPGYGPTPTTPPANPKCPKCGAELRQINFSWVCPNGCE